MRDARREVSLQDTPPSASSAVLAAELQARQSTPSNAAARAEQCDHIRRAMETLDEADREIITLRHFEMLNHRYLVIGKADLEAWLKGPSSQTGKAAKIDPLGRQNGDAKPAPAAKPRGKKAAKESA